MLRRLFEALHWLFVGRVRDGKVAEIKGGLIYRDDLEHALLKARKEWAKEVVKAAHA